MTDSRIEQPAGAQLAPPASERLTSRDGTELAYDRVGRGDPLIIISGGLNQRVMFGKLIALLSDSFTVFNYDRRGRGDSADGDPEAYRMQDELDDLAAVVERTGTEPFVFGNCTGAILAAHASAQGLPLRKVAMYEPPYSVGGGKPPAGPNYLGRLKDMVRENRRDDAVMLFQKEAVGNSDEFVERFRQHPAWPFFAGLAHTLPYEQVIVGDGSVPVEVFTKVAQPTLVIGGGISPEWQRRATDLVVELIPKSQQETLPEHGHVMPQNEHVAGLLRDFFLAEEG